MSGNATKQAIYLQRAFSGGETADRMTPTGPNVQRPQFLLELTRGMTFYLQKFDERTFAASHEHCLNDWKTIAELGPETEGYVTFRDIKAPDGRQGRQYWWVCKSCFGKLQETMAWRVGTELPTGPSAPGNWARRQQSRSQLDREALVAKFPYAIVGWAAEEVVGIASSRGLIISLKEASELLLDNERKIEGAMTKAGYETIVELINAVRRTPGAPGPQSST